MQITAAVVERIVRYARSVSHSDIAIDIWPSSKDPAKMARPLLCSYPKGKRKDFHEIGGVPVSVTPAALDFLKDKVIDVEIVRDADGRKLTLLTARPQTESPDTETENGIDTSPLR